MAVTTGVLPVDILSIVSLVEKRYPRKTHTDTIEAKSVKSGSDVPGKSLTGAISLDTLVKASVVAPATNSKTDFDVMVKEIADLLEGLEGLVLSTGLGGEERRVGEGHHDMGDATGNVLGREILGVPPCRVLVWKGMSLGRAAYWS